MADEKSTVKLRILFTALYQEHLVINFYLNVCLKITMNLTLKYFRRKLRRAFIVKAPSYKKASCTILLLYILVVTRK